MDGFSDLPATIIIFVVVVALQLPFCLSFKTLYKVIRSSPIDRWDGKVSLSGVLHISYKRLLTNIMSCPFH